MQAKDLLGIPCWIANKNTGEILRVIAMPNTQHIGDRLIGVTLRVINADGKKNEMDFSIEELEKQWKIVLK